MTNEEIIDHVALYLEQHLNGARGALTQDGYIHDLFRLFAQAYRNTQDNPSGNSITGDGMLKDIAERWMLDSSEESERKRTLLQRFCRMWDDWQFAWDNCNLKQA